MALTELDIAEIVEAIEYKPDYGLILRFDADQRPFIQVTCMRPDSSTGVRELGYGGKVYLSPHMVPGEIVRKAFGAFLAYEEHESREWFRYKEKQVFGPHISIDALVDIADQKEWRRAIVPAYRGDGVGVDCEERTSAQKAHINRLQGLE